MLRIVMHFTFFEYGPAKQRERDWHGQRRFSIRVVGTAPSRTSCLTISHEPVLFVANIGHYHAQAKDLPGLHATAVIIDFFRRIAQVQ